MPYAIALIFVAICVSFPIRFWLQIRRLGRWEDAVRADAHMFAMDVVAVFLVLPITYWSANAWFGFTLPLFPPPVAGGVMAILAAAACLGVIYCNGRQRWDDATRSRGGMPEATLRWLVSHEIIAAAEVAGALHQKRAKNRSIEL